MHFFFPMVLCIFLFCVFVHFFFLRIFFCTDQKLRRRLIFTLQVSQCCHHGVLGCEIHEHLHPDLLLEGLHDVGLVLQLLPQLGDGGVRLLLQGGQAPLQVGHLAGQ